MTDNMEHIIYLGNSSLSVKIVEDEIGIITAIYDRKTNIAVSRTRTYYAQIRLGAPNDKKTKIKKTKRR